MVGQCFGSGNGALVTCCCARGHGRGVGTGDGASSILPPALLKPSSHQFVQKLLLGHRRACYKGCKGTKGARAEQPCLASTWMYQQHLPAPGCAHISPSCPQRGAAPNPQQQQTLLPERCRGLASSPGEVLAKQVGGNESLHMLPFQKGHHRFTAWRRCASIGIPLRTSAR